jgi:hypothetical protein
LSGLSNMSDVTGRGATPPVPPAATLRGSTSTDSFKPTLTSSGSYRSIADAASIKIEHAAPSAASTAKRSANRAPESGDCIDDGDEDPLESSVLSINLSRAVADPDTLPRSVKLHPSGIGFCVLPLQHIAQLQHAHRGTPCGVAVNRQ